MKKQITSERKICDFCHEEECHEHCLNCKKDACWKCQAEEGVSFTSTVWFRGSGDGFYCHACLALPQVRRSARFQAYNKVKSLKDEYNAWSEDFKQRADKATETLKKHLSK